MIVDDNERQPLLGRRRSEQTNHTNETDEQTTWFGRCLVHIRTSWNVYQIVLLIFFFQTSYYAQVPAVIETARDLSCARYFERHPQLIDLSDPQSQCSSDSIESETARVMLVTDLLAGVGSAISTIYFGKQFATWGRKPILLISLLPNILLPLLLVALPRGYPYGPYSQDLAISPTNCIYIVFATCAITGLLGGQSLALCCYRLLIVDHSDTAERTKNLVYAAIAYLSGVMFGPLFAAAVSYLFPISASSVDGVLQFVFHNLFQSSNILADTPTSPPDLRTEHGIVTPFIVCILVSVLSVFYVTFFVPETAVSDTDPSSTSSDSSKPTTAPITPLRALFPIKHAKGGWDWRIPILFVVMLFIYLGSNVLTIYLFYFGHALHWSASSVGYLLSSLGATRLLTMFVLLPPLILFFEKTVVRPVSIAHFTVEELHQISKGSSAEETPIGESAFASERDLNDTHLLQGAISYWRARVDYHVVKWAWSCEVVGWVIVAVGATFKEVYTLLIGEVLVGFGTGGQPALQSFGLAVTSDVLAGIEKINDTNNHDEDEEVQQHHPSSHGHAGEIFFSLLSFSECVTTIFSPIVTNSIYGATLSSFPAACFLMAATFYSIALFSLSTIRIHRKYES